MRAYGCFPIWLGFEFWKRLDIIIWTKISIMEKGSDQGLSFGFVGVVRCIKGLGHRSLLLKASNSCFSAPGPFTLWVGQKLRPFPRMLISSAVSSVLEKLWIVWPLIVMHVSFSDFWTIFTFERLGGKKTLGCFNRFLFSVIIEEKNFDFAFRFFGRDGCVGLGACHPCSGVFPLWQNPGLC